MLATIKNAIVLVELENGKVHQAIIRDDIMRSFLTAAANTEEGGLKLIETPLEGITLERK